MPIPSSKEIRLPLLKFAKDEQNYSFKKAIPFLANYFELTKEEQNILLRSKQNITLFTKRVYEAKRYLQEAGLLTSHYYKDFQITSKGLEVLAKKPKSINLQFLNTYKENNTDLDKSEIRKSIDYQYQHKEKLKPELEVEALKKVLENAYQQLQEALKKELVETIKQCTPQFFETLVIDLLVVMGYGGSRKEAGRALQYSNDEGIDGIIKEDRLGLDIIYLQAKRWENVVGRPEIQKFAGALQGQKAKKGVFITTSSFSHQAIKYASNIENKIILIDGNRLTELMIEFNVGVTSVDKYEVKRIDSDYFVEN